MLIRVVLLLLLLPALASAQTGPVVSSASFLEWDHDPASAGITDEYRIYLSQTPGIVPDGTPDATVAAPTREWAIVAAPGQWFVIVTAFDVESGVESVPSEEFPFFVFDGPNNLRVR